MAMYLQDHNSRGICRVSLRTVIKRTFGPGVLCYRSFVSYASSFGTRKLYKSFRGYRCKVTYNVRMREQDDHFLEGQRIPTCQYKCSDPTSCLHRGVLLSPCCLEQCFSTARPWPSTGPWYQLCRAARGSLGICRFSFLSNFLE